MNVAKKSAEFELSIFEFYGPFVYLIIKEAVKNYLADFVR